MKNIFKIVLFFISCFIFIFFDQYTKSLALYNLYGKKSYVLIKDVLEFTYTENTGAAFGILKNMHMIFIPLTIIVLFILIYLVYKMKFNIHNIIYFLTLILIFSGALGNFIDRINNKYVIDFIYFKLIDFPVFNLADSYITIGCILFIISYLTIYKKDDLW